MSAVMPRVAALNLPASTFIPKWPWCATSPIDSALTRQPPLVQGSQSLLALDEGRLLTHPETHRSGLRWFRKNRGADPAPRRPRLAPLRGMPEVRHRFRRSPLRRQRTNWNTARSQWDGSSLKRCGHMTSTARLFTVRTKAFTALTAACGWASSRRLTSLICGSRTRTWFISSRSLGGRAAGREFLWPATPHVLRSGRRPSWRRDV